MARLTSGQRNNLPASKFAGPNRSYPVPDASHARDALAMVQKYGTPEEKREVRAAVHRDYPAIDSKK